jgi:arabinan endo-1,5-alpha-L-arabinosidase
MSIRQTAVRRTVIVTAAALASAVVTAAGPKMAPRPGNSSGPAPVHAPQATPVMLPLTGDINPVHDPALIKEGATYYVFCTGGRNGGGVLPIRTSPDLRVWTRTGFVFPDSLPAWTHTEIPQATNAWAPDISFFNGRYHLYYSVSSFGSRNSAIGLVTTRTLDPSRSDYQWTDEGMVLRSHQETDDWNAIDPNVFVEDAAHVWLTWGSFWGGIKMRRLDPRTGTLSAADLTMYALASRPREAPIGGAIEAPFLVKHDGFYYLFASFDRCCRGAMSTYNVRVGRARAVTGPYLDRDGQPMTAGGGTLVLEATTPAWRGPGHEALFADAGQDYLAFHAYPAQGRGSSLFISTLVWDDGWPRVGSLP